MNREKVIETFDAEEFLLVDRDKYTEGYNDGLETGKDIAISLLEEQEEMMKHHNDITLEYQKEVFRLQAKLKEQEAIIEQYRKADGFLATHGWKWEDR